MGLSSWTAALVALVATSALPVTAAPCPAVSARETCAQPYVRKEWRHLSDGQRQQYIGAVQCMMKEPGTATATLSIVRNRFEDFLATHVKQTDFVHFVGIFYPYHRLLLAEYETALWNCGWDRALGQPFWDWTLDTGSKEVFLNSPIFDTALGFGGNGAYIPGNLSHPGLPGFTVAPPNDIPDRSGGGCVVDGPFAGLGTYFGPQNNTEPKAALRCLRRDFSYDSLRERASPAQVQAAMAIDTHGDFEFVTDSQSYHPAGHWGVGGLYGTMTDTYASPADPVFFLHHSNVDQAWWSWQMRDLAAREKDMSGPLVMFDYANKLGGNATLETPVWVGLGQSRVEVKVADLMHIQKGPLCYTYESLY
ncbi:uncharacterized protein PG986_006450 [Apiospora aurea]|uniref:Tyrosinase copper-binding domain-containing protein n=1 Tax=Apiospora aurea TaxID=335848 RepID=A0ABR1QKG1_9PEZI